MPLIKDVLRNLGHDMPEVSAPAANYLPTVHAGSLLFVAGQISQLNGQPAYVGRLGEAISLEDGRRAAETAALAVIAQVVAATNGRIEAVRRVAKLGVFVASTPEFTDHSLVANGASDLMVAVFGDAGRHARAAIGVAALPRGVSVEVEAIIELES